MDLNEQGGRLDRCSHLLLRIAIDVRMDSSGCRWGCLPRIPRGSRPHLGLWIDVQRSVHRHTIWQFGFKIWREKVEAGEAEGGLMGYIKHGTPAFRDEFINTGDNDL